MKELLKQVQAIVAAEYQRASLKFGRTNNSSHESYAIILEEYEEAIAESQSFERSLRMFWNAVRANMPTDCDLGQMQRIAEKASAEWVQVAAMCYKARQKEGDEE